jgi:hypothetical protein
MATMTFVLQAGFDVEISEGETRCRDIYRLADLPRELKELVVCQRARDEVEWFSPDGARWRVRPALM